MSDNKKKCTVIKKHLRSTAYTSEYFTNWYEAITKAFNNYNMDAPDFIEISLENKNEVMKLV